MLRTIIFLILSLTVYINGDDGNQTTMTFNAAPVVLITPTTMIPVVVVDDISTTVLVGTVTPATITEAPATTSMMPVRVLDMDTTMAPAATTEGSMIMHEADHHHHTNDTDMQHNHTLHHLHEDAHHVNMTEVDHSSSTATTVVPVVSTIESTMTTTTTMLADLSNANKAANNRNKRQWGYGGYGLGYGLGGLGYGMGMGLGGFGMGYGGYGGFGGFGGGAIMDTMSVTDVIY